MNFCVLQRKLLRVKELDSITKLGQWNASRITWVPFESNLRIFFYNRETGIEYLLQQRIAMESENLPLFTALPRRDVHNGTADLTIPRQKILTKYETYEVSVE